MTRTRLAAALALLLALAAGWGWTAPAPEPVEKDPRSPQLIDEAQRELRSQRRQAQRPNPDLEELWMAWQRFRTAYAGTPEWRTACEVMARAPSPLDQLDPGWIPEQERFDWQPPGLVAVLGEHWATGWGRHIEELAVSPDGKLIATTGAGLWLWDASTQRKKVFLLDRSGAGVPFFSPDGRTLIAQCGSSVCLWDLDGDRPRKRFAFNANPGFFNNEGTKEPDTTQRIFLVGDGKTLIAGGRYEHRWWDVSGKTPKEQGPFVLNMEHRWDEPHFAADGRSVSVVCHSEDRFRLFAWANGQLKGRAGPTGVVDKKTAFSADGRTLAVLVKGEKLESRLELWDLAAENPRPTLSVGGIVCDDLKDVTFAPDGKLVAFLDSAGALWFWALDRDAAKAAGMRAGETMKRAFLNFMATRIRITADRRTVVFGCEDGTVRLWDVAEDKEGAPLQGHTGPVKSIAFAPDGRTLAALGEDGRAHLWELDGPPRERVAWRAHVARGRRLLFTADGKGLFTLGGEDANYPDRYSAVRLWDLAGDKPQLQRKADYTDLFQNMALSPDGQFLALGGHGRPPGDKDHDGGMARLVDPLADKLPTLYDIRPGPADSKGHPTPTIKTHRNWRERMFVGLRSRRTARRWPSPCA